MYTVPILQPAPVAASSEAPSAVDVTTAMESFTLAAPERTVSSTSPTVTIAAPGIANTAEQDATAQRPHIGAATVPRYPKLHRRDSLERREALLKGKEGSRQRRRWENDRLMDNPAFAPPLPSDWEVRPTYHTYTGRRRVPYWLAPLWDAAEFQRAVEAKLKGRRNSTRKRGGITGVSPMEEAAASIPKEVRGRLKYAPGAKRLFKDLEEDVRDFVKRWNERELRLRRDGLGDLPVVDDSEDEEIVFVGRSGAMLDGPSGKEEDETISREKLVFDAAESDKGAGFVRWLVHSLGTYYGLRTWSVTTEVEGEQRRQAYVGIDTRARGFMRGSGIEFEKEFEMPRPIIE